MKHPSRTSCKLFVEGGAPRNAALQTECRRAFARLLERAGFGGRLPRVVACGSRRAAYEQFCTAVVHLGTGEVAVLLVDSESAVTGSVAWDHVVERDSWSKPEQVGEDHLHLMVQCMETWLLADRVALSSYFGIGFRESSLPASGAQLERISVQDVHACLKDATRATKTKGRYDKGRHSFKLLALLDPASIRGASPWAERLFSTLDELLGPAGP